MFCPKCGTQNDNGARFCASCGLDLTSEASVSVAGAPQTPPPPPAQNFQQPDYQQAQTRTPYQQSAIQNPCQQPAASKFKPAIKLDAEFIKKYKKNIIIGAAAVALLVLIIAVISAVAGGGSKYIADKYDYYVISDDKEKYTVYCNGKQIGDFSRDDDNVYFGSPSSTQDGSVNAFTMGDKIVYVTNKAVKILDVEADGTLLLSKDGGTIVYTLTESTDRGSYTELFSYNVKSDKSTSIDDDVVADSVRISPSANVIVYNKIDTDGTREFYLYNKGKAEKIAKELYPIAVDDKAKYIYAYSTDYEPSIYTLTSNGDKNKLSGDYQKSYIVNDDRTQIIFVANEKVYFSVKGGEKVKLFGADSSYIYSGYINVETPMYRYADLSDLCGHVYSSGNNYYYLNDGKAEATKLCGGSSTHNFTLSADGKTAYYVDVEDTYDMSGKLVKVSVGAKSEKDTLVKEEVTSFVVTPKNVVYYGNEDYELRYLSGKKDEKVADDIEGAFVSGSGVVFFGDDDSTLYSVKGKSGKNKIADDVCSFGCFANFTYYENEYDNEDFTADAYISDGSAKFKEAGKEVYFFGGLWLD